MMSSESSTRSGRVGRDSGFTATHLYLLLAMAGATWAVIAARDTHPASLLLLTGAILAAGFTGVALHHALVGFFTGGASAPAALSVHDRAAIEQEKALVLRSIKELEFDRGMGKVGDADFAEIGGRLRARAMALIDELDRLPAEPMAPSPPPAAPVPVAPPDPPAPVAPPATDTAPVEASAARFCGECGAPRVPDARFCTHCGARLR